MSIKVKVNEETLWNKRWTYFETGGSFNQIRNFDLLTIYIHGDVLRSGISQTHAYVDEIS